MSKLIVIMGFALITQNLFAAKAQVKNIDIKAIAFNVACGSERTPILLQSGESTSVACDGSKILMQDLNDVVVLEYIVPRKETTPVLGFHFAKDNENYVVYQSDSDRDGMLILIEARYSHQVTLDKSPSAISRTDCHLSSISPFKMNCGGKIYSGYDFP